MAFDGRDSRLRRKEAVGMEQLVQDFIRDMRISSGINRQRAAQAWNEVSGASRYTLDVSLEKGVLYCSISSSMVRNQLYFQRDVLVEDMNKALMNDQMFMFQKHFFPIFCCNTNMYSFSSIQQMFC